MGNRSRWASGTLADRLPNVMALKHCLAKRLSEPFWALRQLLGSLSFNASRRHYLEEKENQEENNQAAPMRRPGRATAWEENERRRISIQGLQQQRRPSLDHLFIVSVRAYYAPSGARPSGLSSSILTALDLGTWGISNAATLPKAERIHQVPGMQPSQPRLGASDRPQCAGAPQPREDAGCNEPTPHFPAAAMTQEITQAPGPVSAQRLRRLAKPWHRVTS